MALIYLLYGSMWLLSIYLQYFEYIRGLPHAWYTHHLFWVTAAVFNLVRFAFLIWWDQVLDFSDNHAMSQA